MPRPFTAARLPQFDDDRIAGSVSRIDSKLIEHTQSLNLPDALRQHVPGLAVNDVAGNPFQPNVQFRGFTASPIAGTSQGLALYQNGMRINEAFGDIANWDLVPTAAIRSVAVVANNPAYGLNALGGAIDVRMKDGFVYNGAGTDTMGGSFGRIQNSTQWGKRIGDFAVYGAIEGLHERGFRDASGSSIRRFYGDVGYKGSSSEFHLNMGLADNSFGATGPVPIELLQRRYSAVYTTPQSAMNQVGYLNLAGRVEATSSWTLEGSAHLRAFNQNTQNGNSTNIQPCTTQPLLLCVGNGAAPASGTDGAQLSNRFAPGTVLGQIDRTATQSETAGATVQATHSDQLFGHDNRFVTGISLDSGLTRFSTNSELGTMGRDYVVGGSGAFLGPSGTPVSIGPAALRGTNQYGGFYAINTFDVTNRFSISGGGRFNVARLTLEDQLGTSPNAVFVFDHFNPSFGGTYKLTPITTAYAGYSEANRAPTALELGCSDPTRPCSAVSTAPLKQVISHTVDVGLRGSYTYGDGRGAVDWRVGAFRIDNANDIFAIPSPVLQGFSYFQNIGSTRRQGIESEITLRAKRFELYANYAFLDARFRDSLMISSNSPFADANGRIRVQPGNRIPVVAAHNFKAGIDYAVTDALKVGGDVLVVSSQFFDGDESNQSAKLPAYAVFNLHGSYQIDRTFQIYGLVDNIFDRRYASYGTFFDSRALGNYFNGSAPFTDARAVSPARPRALYVGLKASF